MNGLVERVKRMEAQIDVLKDEKFEYKSKTKELEIKLSQSEERIDELESNLQEQMEELGCCIKEDAFKKLKRKVSILGQQRQQLKKQDQDTNDKFQRLDKLQLLLNSIMLGKSSTDYRNSLVEMRSEIDNLRDRFNDLTSTVELFLSSQMEQLNNALGSMDTKSLGDSSPVPERIQLSDSDTENKTDRPHSPENTVPGSSSAVPSHFQLFDSDTEKDHHTRHSTGSAVLGSSSSVPSHLQLFDSDTEKDHHIRHSTGSAVLDPKTKPDTDNVSKSQGDKTNEATDTAPSPKTPKKRGLTRFLGAMTRKSNRHIDPGKGTTDGNKTQQRPMLFKTKVRALHSNVGLGKNHLSFERGDLMEIDGANTFSEDWLEATHLKTKEQGLIPGNFFIKDDSPINTQNWLVEYDCKDLEKKLLLPGNPKGTFLVTEQTADESSYVLSVRDTDKANGEPSVKRYGVYKKDSDQSYFIRPDKTFPSLDDLISHYQNMSDVLCCRLTTPCPRIPAVVQFSQLEINRDNLHLSNQLGVGRFSQTMRGTLYDVLDVAVKTRQKTMTPEDFLNEAKIMHHLRHERLVQLLAIVSANEPFYIITDLMIYGTLQSFLRSERGNSLKLDTLIAMNSQIAEGMAFLERLNVVHRDLRAGNILVGQDFEVKVANFALARKLENDNYGDLKQGLYLPVRWLAPETVEEKVFSVKSDVWSFGVLMYEIITLGQKPYSGMTNKEVTDKVGKGWRMEKPSDGPIEVPDFYYKMMLECWDRVPKQRPSFEFLHYDFDNYFTYEGIYSDLP